MPLKEKIAVFALNRGVTDDDQSVIGYCDVDLFCRYANNAHLHWFGKSPDQIINKLFLWELLGPFLFKNSRNYIDRALQGKTQEFECLVVISSGEIKKAKTIYVPDIENGAVVGFFIYSFDARQLIASPEKADSQGIEKEKTYVISSTDFIIDAVVQTLRSCVLTGFPGIEKLSKKHFISESKLKTAFKKAHNTTIFNYYRNLQMEVAHDYITRKIANKGQMAIKFNFSNPSNFSSRYKKYLKEKYTKNIGHQNRAGQILNDNDEQYKKFIEQLPTASAMIDNDFVYMAVSQMWYSVFKVDCHDLKGKSFFVISPGSEIKYRKMLMNCLNEDDTHFDEEFIEKVDGSSAWVRWDVKPWYQSTGKAGGLLIFTTDITTLKIRAEENKRYKKTEQAYL
jgi:PAS domain S-box-containing protein